MGGTTLNNVTDAYTYDSYGRLASYTATYTPTSTVLYTYTLTRDDVGRITQKVETIGGVTDTYEYAYDNAGRLSTVEKNNVVTDSFTYDSNSNRTSGTINGAAFTATYDDQDRILTFNTQTYTHNRNGDLTKIQWNLTDATDFVYDVMGNLKQATIPGGTVLDYTSDGMDRRIVKRSNSTFQWRYIYENQLRVAAVLNGSSAYGREFVYATKVNVPDYMIFNGNKFRIITDHLGSPRLAVRSDTGAISQRMDYTVLGHVTNDTNPGFQPFGFAGGIYDAQIGLVRFGARDYDPRIGRWTAKDPIRFEGGDTNLFGYVLSSPVDSIDPSGLATYDCWEWTGDVPHNYLCVGNSCGGQGPQPDASYADALFFGTEGYNSSGAAPDSASAICKKVETDKEECMDRCVDRYLQGNRPRFSIFGSGESCFGFVNRVIKVCASSCK